MQNLTNNNNLRDVIPLWNAFHVLIVVIVLQYHLIPILIVLLLWMIAFIMANVGTLHAKTVLKRKKYSSYVLLVWLLIVIHRLMDQQPE